MTRTTEIISGDGFVCTIKADPNGVRGKPETQKCLSGFRFPVWHAALAVTFFLTAPTLVAGAIAYGGTALRQAANW